ncbi:hypothetical protein THAOC_07312 [Thalassiosira oceanica]|uniref:Thioesterase domain-containing protein n=1 Tax=Thalassiosira oceanica TaxID=159749 RepID=K0T293_THAOC|nr:hypothetical protein THAOC_07312 [Thalassiosira oceanica]|eukprot:EJK71269.1 hypothetical protein THAOC_07312 [Thalassiosira oceanica]
MPMMMLGVLLIVFSVAPQLASPFAQVSSIPAAPAASKTRHTWTSPTKQIFIEDTDAYGVIYNANYARCYERALSHVPREEELGGDEMILSSVEAQKYSGSPPLGGQYVIRGERLEASTNKEVWSVELTSPPVKDTPTMVHNSAQVTLSRGQPLKVVEVTSPTQAEGVHCQYKLIAYKDELDTCIPCDGVSQQEEKAEYYVSVRSAMCYFERARSTFLGGPDMLRKLQEEENLLYVVTSNSDCHVYFDTILVEGGIEGELEMKLRPGDEVTVQTMFSVRRRGMIVDCRHRLYLGDGPRRLLAKATITIMALNGTTRRPTSKLPQWLVDKFTA